jgi:hypothetical protein
MKNVRNWGGFGQSTGDHRISGSKNDSSDAPRAHIESDFSFGIEEQVFVSPALLG